MFSDYWSQLWLVVLSDVASLTHSHWRCVNGELHQPGVTLNLHHVIASLAFTDMRSIQDEIRVDHTVWTWNMKLQTLNMFVAWQHWVWTPQIVFRRRVMFYISVVCTDTSDNLQPHTNKHLQISRLELNHKQKKYSFIIFTDRLCKHLHTGMCNISVIKLESEWKKQTC